MFSFILVSINDLQAAHVYVFKEHVRFETLVY